MFLLHRRQLVHWTSRNVVIRDPLLHSEMITKWASIKQLNIADNGSTELDILAVKALFNSRTVLQQ